MSAQLDEDLSVNWDKVVMGPSKVVTFNSDVVVKEVEKVLDDDTGGESIAKDCQSKYFSGHYSSAAQEMMMKMGWRPGEDEARKT